MVHKAETIKSMMYTSTRSARFEHQRAAAQDRAEVEQGRGHQKGGQPPAWLEHVDLRLRQVVRQIGDQRYHSHPQRPDPIPRHHLEEDVQQADEDQKRKIAPGVLKSQAMKVACMAVLA